MLWAVHSRSWLGLARAVEPSGATAGFWKRCRARGHAGMLLNELSMRELSAIIGMLSAMDWNAVRNELECCPRSIGIPVRDRRNPHPNPPRGHTRRRSNCAPECGHRLCGGWRKSRGGSHNRCRVDAPDGSAECCIKGCLPPPISIPSLAVACWRSLPRKLPLRRCALARPGSARPVRRAGDVMFNPRGLRLWEAAARTGCGYADT
jgi:hypothetical protein